MENSILHSGPLTGVGDLTSRAQMHETITIEACRT